MTRGTKRVLQAIYRLYAVRANVHLGQHVHIGLGSILWAPSELVVEDEVYIGKGCTIECNGRIGRGSLIANRVGMVGRSDHQANLPGIPIRSAPWVGDTATLQQAIIVGPDVWVGYGAILVSGITVGRGAVVGAGAVVTKDIPPYAVVVGNPAREVGRRFDALGQAAHDLMLATPQIDQ